MILVAKWKYVIYYRNVRNHLVTNLPCRDCLIVGLQLPVQSVPITSNIVSSNPVYEEVYSIEHFLIKFISDLRQVDDFLLVSRFPSPIKLTATI